jgi:hypothetical protein
MGVIGGKNIDSPLRPSGADVLDEPCGVGGSYGQTLIDLREDRRTFEHESTQYGVDEPGGPLQTEEPRRIDGGVNSRFGSVAGVLHLVRRDRKQCPYGRSEGLGARRQTLERWSEAQIPSQGPESNGTDRRGFGCTRGTLQTRGERCVG